MSKLTVDMIDGEIRIPYEGLHRPGRGIVAIPVRGELIIKARLAAGWLLASATSNRAGRARLASGALELMLDDDSRRRAKAARDEREGGVKP